MSKKIPIYVLILLIIILLPFFALTIKMNGNTELKNNKNNLIENYSSYEKKLSKLGYKSKLITEDGNKLIAIYTEHITFKFGNLNSCTAVFSNKSPIGQKYTGEMYTKNIGEDNISVTITETYQNTELTYSCSYDPAGFDIIIIDSPDYDKNDREIKKIIEEDYSLTNIYLQMKNINDNLKSVNTNKD